MYCSRHEQCSCEQNRNVLSSWSLHSGRGDRPRGREIRKIDGTQGGGVSVLEKKEAEKRDRKRGWVGSHFNRGGWRRLHEKLTVD